MMGGFEFETPKFKGNVDSRSIDDFLNSTVDNATKIFNDVDRSKSMSIVGESADIKIIAISVGVGLLIGGIIGRMLR